MIVLACTAAGVALGLTAGVVAGRCICRRYDEAVYLGIIVELDALCVRAAAENDKLTRQRDNARTIALHAMRTAGMYETWHDITHAEHAGQFDPEV